MSVAARKKLAVATATLGKPVVVLDDAALTFLASQPEASITTTIARRTRPAELTIASETAQNGRDWSPRLKSRT